MTRTEKYKDLREAIKLDIAKHDKELYEYDVKMADSEVLKELSKQQRKVLND